MTNTVLLLNADYTPLRVIPWEDAVIKLLDRKVRLVTEYSGRVIRSANTEMAFPAVVALTKFAPTTKKVRFNRANLLARDAYTCQYCGVRPQTKGLPPKPRLEDLTLDHVVPRAQSRKGEVVLPWNKARVSVTCWENVVAACMDCNAIKADRTPDQAGMKLRRFPSRPTAWDSVMMTLRRTHVPDEWKSFLPENSGWRGYWDVELDPD